jgi:hypothetical protein
MLGGQILGENGGELRSRQNIMDSNISDGDALTKQSRHAMLHALVLDGVD